MVFSDNPTITTEVVETKKSLVTTAKNEQTIDSLNLWREKMKNYFHVNYVKIFLFL